MKTKKQDDVCKSAENLKVDKKKSKVTGEKSEASSSSKNKTNTRVRTIKEMFLNSENLQHSLKNDAVEKKIKSSENDVTLSDNSPKQEKKKVASESKTESPKSSGTESKPKENKKPKKDGAAKSVTRPAKTMGRKTVKKPSAGSDKSEKLEPVEVKEAAEQSMEVVEEITEVGEGCTLGSIMRLNFKAEVCPSARWGHSLTMLNESEAILIGGQGGQGDKQQLSKDACLMLSISRHRWHSPETFVEQGQKPEARMGHTAVFDPTVRCLYLFGGSKNKRWFNDVHVLDVDEMKWQIVKANGKAPTRAYHTSTLYRNELWIFGGVFPQPDPQPDGCSNDIHVYSPVEESWYMPIVMGDKPVPRSGHSATLLQDRIVFFGGWDYPVVFNDVNILDLTLVEWSQPKVNGTPPAPRSWHSSCALYGNRVLIHGGYDGNIALQDSFVFNLDTLTWTSIVIPSNIPARCGHTACCLPYKYDKDGKDDVIIFGGGDNDGAFFEDLLCLRVPIDK